ncbi:MAG: crotonyl-CoA carboxylase/reductase [Alphaproteobacteria bacterium]|jgi:crotonyl-CoA carboxylase/reductase|nr:crotonyl-CoA carboxylase/reductase [Alphaproteobacteria bacterium]MDP6517846.1 crotonyl-CoA carboxylase/reductase [Alphaproteobacteria bacterium]
MDLCDLGARPSLGDIPRNMHAFVVRQDRFGAPKDAWRREVIPTPDIGPRDVLIYVMATGINYNNVWAALGFPVDVIADRQKKGEPEDFHAGGSDCSGIVWAVGTDVTDVAIGDEVVVHSGWWEPEDPWVLSGKDPMLAPSTRIWGYQTNYGSYCQFARAQSHQCQQKPGHLTWEQAACYMLCASTAYRMLMGWPPHCVEAGDVVLVWGAAGGLGSMALQIAAAKGAKPVAVISDEDKRQYCLDHGAVGAINRNDFDHWGPMPSTASKEWRDWSKGARAFGKAIWDCVGERKSPRIVFEHPGEATLPTSDFVCDTGGMVVICAGTSGYDVTMDLRYHWMMQKRFQGSHLSNDEQAAKVNQMIIDKAIDPCLSGTYGFDEIGHAHQLMHDNKHPFGNMACLVNAPEPGQGASGK